MEKIFEKIFSEVESTVRSELETFYRMSGIKIYQMTNNYIGVFI
jgi:hypothetical protein